MKNIDKVAEFNNKMREFDKCNSFLCSFLCKKRSLKYGRVLMG